MEPNTTSDEQVRVTVKPTRVLHFSDGVDEEIEVEEATEVTSSLHNDEPVDTSKLDWLPWMSHYAWTSGNKVLNIVDAAGESLASFFGITTPKYQIEIDEYERMQEEKRKMEEESAGWVPRNGGGDIPLVMNEPKKAVDTENHV
ncbi:protein FAM177A1 [Amyelois transitella]|uniref:protein FAM177A1 n=1 Tax=Amyelois transitella TaxID=680683 RepID=UPI00298FAB42|nr:protein FAM177A1 [Amyelois transitella]